MSIKQGGKTIAGAKQYHPDLFDFKWADHILNDVQWLRADTFSWQSGAVYQAAYQHLADDIDGKILQSETIGTTTIQFYLADDGHKICPASEANNVAAIYTDKGVAWYYIIDTANQRFKLPRTKFAFVGLRDTVGNYIGAGLPNITGQFRNYGWGTSLFVDVETQGALYRSGTARGIATTISGSTGSAYKDGLSIDASLSSNVYGASDTVQPRATEMYLYFYVGNFTQTALENTAGVSTEILNDLNEHKLVASQVPTSSNNQTWYRKYADGWVEMGGRATIPGRTNTGGSGIAITFPVGMKNTFYTVQITIYNGGAYWASWQLATNSITTTGFTAYAYLNATATAADLPIMWSVSGVAA